MLGLITAMMIQIGLPLYQQDRLAATTRNMDNIINVLSVYAQRNNRIPCPADPATSDTLQPFGAERGSGASGTSIPAACVIDDGIVPYRTLGLSPDDILDAQGHYLTYHINPSFARNPTALNPVHAWCRGPSWVQGGTNLDPMRAEFCCSNIAVPGKEIRIKDTNGNSLFAFTRDTGNYASVNSEYTGATLSQASNNITTPIVVLVSYGDVGGGYYLKDSSTGARAAATPQASANELINMSGGNTFIWGTRDDNSDGTPNQHFDDIVMWRTQDQLYAETGNGSCALP